MQGISAVKLNGTPLSETAPGLFESPEGVTVKLWLHGQRFAGLVANGNQATGRLYYQSIEILPERGLSLALDRPLPSGGGHLLLERGAFVVRGNLRPSTTGKDPERFGTRSTPALQHIYPSGLEDLPEALPNTRLSPVGPYQVSGEPAGNEPAGLHVCPLPAFSRPSDLALRWWRDMLDGYVARSPLWALRPGTIDPLWDADLVQNGVLPFQYDTQARCGIVDHTGKQLPSGVITGIPPFEASRGNSGFCGYEPQLRAWLAPDGQHLVRALAPCMALMRWTDDPIAPLFAEMLAADASWDWTSFPLHAGAWQPTTARLALQRIAARPHDASGALDREAWWVFLATAVAGTPRQKRVMSAILTESYSEDGVCQRIRSPGSGGNVVYWQPPGVPIGTDCAPTFQLAMQALAAHALLPDYMAGEIVTKLARAVFRYPLVQSVYSAGQKRPAKAIAIDADGRAIGAYGTTGEELNCWLLLGLALRYGARDLIDAAKQMAPASNGVPALTGRADDDAWTCAVPRGLP